MRFPLAKSKPVVSLRRMTSEEMAAKIVAELERLGCVARVHKNSGGECSVMLAVARADADVPAFRVDDRVVMLGIYSLKLDKPACRNQIRKLGQWTDIARRCALLAEVVRDTVAVRAEKALAWEVCDALANFGLPATTRDGRVVLTMSFTPEYARKMGPRIAALFAEREP